MTTPAEELRAAAAKIRELAARAGVGPWCVEYAIDAIRTVEQNIDLHINTDCGHDDKDCRSFGEDAGRHIALWHPGVAALVATWLGATADDMSDEHAHVVDHPEWVGCAADQRWGVYAANSRLDSEPWKRALIVARAINGGVR